MREISTLTKEEVSEFINAIDIGKFEISKFKYIKSRKVLEVKTITEWVTTDDDGGDISINTEDVWLFGQSSYDTYYPLERSYDLLYFEFLLAKGFKENRFK